MSSPPRTISSPTTPISPAPHEYNSIIHSIQRRSRDRASTGGSSTEDQNSWRPKQPVSHQHEPTPDYQSLLRDLEADLRLSAEVGVALLAEKSALEKRVGNADTANQKLLDRLTSSVKESSQLQRLEQAESNNRALLVALEEDRKKISRLTADGARLSSSASQLKLLSRSHEDTQQELNSERKRANVAEARVRKQGERVTEMEDRLKRAIEDLEEMRQDKVLRSRKSHDALAKVRARFTTTGKIGSTDNGETLELLKIVESLVTENDMLRSESLELHEMLDLSRDEQSGLRSAIADREAFLEEDEDRLPPQHTSSRLSAGNLQSEGVMSPSASHSSDLEFDRLNSPASTNPTSFTRSWAPSSSLSSSRARGLARTNSSRSVSPAPDEPPSRHAHFSNYMQDANGGGGGAGEKPRGPNATKRMPGGAGVNVLSRSSGPGKVPFGRGHGRRAMSMDASLEYKVESAPPSPIQSPHIRSESVASTDDDSSIRPRRHHRPLSLSLGPSLFPLVPEDSPSTPPTAFPSYKRHRSAVSISISNTDTDTPGAGLGISELEESIGPEPTKGIMVTVDSSTQTSPPATPTIRVPSNSSSGIRIRSPSPTGFDTPPASASEVSGASSDGGGGERSLSTEFGLGFGLNVGGDARTAALGALIEHAGKLLGRIQSADVATLEKRLKKQNLPGDVRHLAQANLKDLVNDIEGLRVHFRRVLEQERAKDGGMSPQHDHESLVLRRDFVSLVKLFRDLLFETSRLRALVNRVQLEPALAASLRDLDTLNTIEMISKSTTAATATTSGGLLAPFSRLFGNALSSEPAAMATTTPQRPITPRPSSRPIAKISTSIAVSSQTVNVEFGKGAVRRAVAHGPGEEGDNHDGKAEGRQGSLGRKQKTENQVKRDLSSIFAGGLPPPRSPTEDPWVVLTPAAKARPTPSSNPFGRLLAAYRPSPATMSSTTNAVLDSFAHAPQPDQEYQPTLLERQLRPRGLSDSSIRSTFVAHANPHHRLISPATLALSSEVTVDTEGMSIAARPILLRSNDSEDSSNNLKAVLSSSMRKPSTQRLRTQPSQSQLRSESTPVGVGASSHPSHEQGIPPVPSLPISISVSPSNISVVPPLRRAATTGSSVVASPPPPSSSMFNNLSHWAIKAAGISAVDAEELGGKSVRSGEDWVGPSSLMGSGEG
ncbi:hypothetical protein P7C70_g1369, partial [Phenoliferia sp. Uapishka_3]